MGAARWEEQANKRLEGGAAGVGTKYMMSVLKKNKGI